MCSIVIAADKEFAKEQVIANAYRGVLNHSITCFDSNGLLSMSKNIGKLDVDIFDDMFDDDINFCIIHQQAPTNGSSHEFIHPSELENTFLWHNGIIKNDQVMDWQLRYGPINWDTALLHRYYNREHNLNGIDGSFACVWASMTDVFIFRNAIAPLFYSERGFSSTKFDGAQKVPHDKVFHLEFDIVFQLEEVSEFKSHNVPYLLS